MAVKSGFFNSVDGDRKYDAEDVNSFFDAIVAEGVLSTFGNAFVVEVLIGMQITVETGKGWFLNSWLTNTTSKTLTLSTADITYTRIDIIALDFNKAENVRTNTIVVVEGTPAFTPIPPALIDLDNHLQIPLAHILVGDGVTEIISANITNKIGTTDCPLATGLIDQIDITDLLTQWEGEFDIWLAASDGTFTTWLAASDVTFTDWMAANATLIADWDDEFTAFMDGNATLIADWDTEFRAWLLQIEADLAAIDTGDVFTELAEIRRLPTFGRNLIINGDMLVNQRTLKETVVGFVDDDQFVQYLGVADRWAFDVDEPFGTWTLSREEVGDGRLSYKALCTSAVVPLSASRCKFSQIIEANRFVRLFKGTTDAKSMTLSWDFKSNVTGTYIIEIYDEQNDWSISTAISHLVSGVWKSFEILIPEETSQVLSLGNTAGITVSFWMLAGSSFTSGGVLQTTWGVATKNQRAYGQVNVGGSVGNYFEITDIQLELGSEKTEYERLSHDDVLYKCQRYMEWIEEYQFVGLVIGIAHDLVDHIGRNYQVRKRVPPTFDLTSSWLLREPGLCDLVSPVEWAIPTRYIYPAFRFTNEHPTGLSTGQAYRCVINDFHIDAEIYY